MMRCAHCRRRLTREPVMREGCAYGPTCARNLFGAVSKRTRKSRGTDERQAEMFEGVPA